MNKSVVLPLLSALALLAVPSRQACGEFRLGVAADDGGLRSFYLAIGDYYRCPERDIHVVRERGISDDEMPVVFFLSNFAHVSPAVIVDLRLRGWSWDRITLHFGASPEVYYVPVPVVVTGPPYGKAYGHFRKVPRHKWSTIRLSDDDIVNLVNLRFVSEHNHVAAHEVIELRSGGKPFHEVYRNAKSGGGKHGKASAAKRDGHSDRSRSGRGKHGR